MVRLSSTSDFGNSRKEQRPEAAASPAAGVVQGEGTNFYYYNQQPAINHQFHAEDLKVQCVLGSQYMRVPDVISQGCTRSDGRGTCRCLSFGRS